MVAQAATSAGAAAASSTLTGHAAADCSNIRVII
jgi:hypothetical protein